MTRSDGMVLASVDGIASFVHPASLDRLDARTHRRYERIAPVNGLGERVLGWMLTGAEESAGRREIVALSGLARGMRLLEVSPGPGVFQPLLREAVGPEGEIAALDLSLNMLRQCRKRHARMHIELIHADAQKLPFADECFDGLFHFGGVNPFNEPARALAEFVRVVRKGGTVIWDGERMSPPFRRPLGRRIRPSLDPGFASAPPVSAR